MHTPHSKIIFVSGGTGFIGQSLVKELNHQDAWEVFSFGRWNDDTEQKASLFLKNPGNSVRKKECVVIHLAGANILAKPWTETYKKEILESRTGTIHKIHSFLHKNGLVPDLVVGASAVGYYGNYEGTADETSPPGNDFLSQVCVEWEKTYQEISGANTRLCILRLGVVMDKTGGALKQLLVNGGINTLFLPAGGNFPLNWISLKDLIKIFMEVLHQRFPPHIYNAVNESQDTYRSFIKKLKKQKHIRFPSFSVPMSLLQCITGEKIQALVSHKRVIPLRLKEQGFIFEESVPG